MADHSSTRSLADIIDHIKGEAKQWPDARDPDEPRELLLEALGEIDRRLRVLEPCTAQSERGHHLWAARKSDGSRLLDGDPWALADHFVCACCEVRR